MPQLSLAELTEITGATLQGDPSLTISGVEELLTAQKHHACFFEHKAYEKAFLETQATVVVVSPKIAESHPERTLLIHPQPTVAFQKILELFLSPILSGFSGVHPTAVIHASAQIAEDVHIGPHVVIDREARVAQGCRIESGAHIGPEATLDEGVLMHTGAIVAAGSQIGKRVIIHEGAVIGSDGFRFVTDAEGIHQKVPQLGIVIIEDDVEIGANTTIDRARFKATRIGRGTKIDNLVQIGHQVELGEDNIIVSQVGIAGSTKTGRHVVMGGQCGVIDYIEITDNVTLAARSAPTKSITESGTYYGAPAEAERPFMEHFICLRNLKKYAKKIKELEKLANTYLKEVQKEEPL